MNIIEEKLRNGVKESLRQRFKERRGKLEIMADILSVARNGAAKTEIAFRVNLNFNRLKGYIAYLEAKGLLENTGPSYKSTERGKEFLGDYQRITEVFQGSSSTVEN